MRRGLWIGVVAVATAVVVSVGQGFLGNPAAANCSIANSRTTLSSQR
jgi:hypothetical protein